MSLSYRPYSIKVFSGNEQAKSKPYFPTTIFFNNDLSVMQLNRDVFLFGL